eukprot:GFUD01021662.1.p1 GENE.GFUD01021662.1~~GFUD01021662.1.p1  ORF type:complete len:717 (+),score=252.28 GFUD01021662.1:121-2271(+)
MRRSLRDAEPPQRLRSNEVGTGGVGGATSGNRQGRTKSLLPQSTVLSTGKRQSSLSRLPMPGGNKGRQGGRSSSSGGQVVMGERGKNTTTPMNKGPGRASSGNRSSERLKANPRDYMTPQRVTTTRMSMTSEKRLTSSVAGSHQRLSGRGSQIGTKGGKDTRPLGDKVFQQSQVRKILDFLRMTNYSNESLTSKHFPLSSKEFVCIFNFLYSFLDPRTDSVLPLTRFDEEVLKLLKTLHYPGNLSRSHFVTMGSLHSWPTVLGSLSFMCDMASIYSQKLFPNIIALGFPNKDESGFTTDRESKEKIQYEHHLDCWHEFNNGADEFPEQLNALNENLMENNGVDVERLEYLGQQKTGLEQELGRLEERGSRKAELLEQKEAFQLDIAKMTDYLHKIEKHITEKQEEGDLKTRELEEECGRLEGTRAEVVELRANCEQGKVSHLEVEKHIVLIGERKRQVETARQEVEEMEKEVWQKEIKVSREKELMDSLAKQINSLAMQEGLKTQSGETICLHVETFQGGRGEGTLANSMRTELSEMARSSRTLTRNTERELQEVVTLYEKFQEEVAMRKKELMSKKAEVARIVEETTKQKEQVDREELLYDKQLADIREQLHHLKSQDRDNTEWKQRELVTAKDRLEKLQQKRKEEEAAGREFLRKVADKTVSYMEECTGYRDKAAMAVLETARARVEMVRRAGTEIQEKVDKALKDTERHKEGH